MKTVSGFIRLSGVALLTTLFAMPVLAQTGFPSGIPDMSQFPSPPAGYTGTTPPTMGPSGIPEGMGPPAGVQDKMNQGLDKLKGSVKRMQKAVDQMRKAIAAAAKAGYPASQDVIDSTDKGQRALDTISKAATMDDATLTAIDDFNAFVDVLDANIESLLMLANFPRITAQADREIPRLNADFDKAQKALADGKIDLSTAIADIAQRIKDLQKTYDDAKAAAKNKDAEKAFSLLQDNFFPGLADIHQSIGMLQAAKNLSRASVQIARGITVAQSIVTKLKTSKVDTTALQSIIDQSKAKLDAFKAMLKTKGFDVNAAVGLLDDLDALRGQFEDKLIALYDASQTDSLTIPPGMPKFFTAPVTVVPKEFKGMTIPDYSMGM